MNTYIMTRLIKYVFLSCLLFFSVFVVIFHIYPHLEPFNTDWNPITDPNHVQSHKNEISYLSEWISILDKGGMPSDAHQVRELLEPKETHIQWHLDQLPKPPLVKQTNFLFF